MSIKKIIIRLVLIFQALDKKSDCQLFIFKINEVVANRNSESRYLLIERTPMAMPFLDPSGLVNEQKNGNISWYVHFIL